MSIMKKMVLVVLAMMLITLPALAREKLVDGDFEYTLREDGTAQIEMYLGSGDPIIEIPSELGGVPVTEIKAMGAARGAMVIKVVIPDSVIYMNPWYDQEETEMDEMQYPNNPFFALEYLETIELSGNNPAFEVIDGVLFTKSETGRALVCYPHALAGESYIVPEGTVALGVSALSGAEFVEVSLPSTLTAVSHKAFAECPNLKRTVLPESVTELSSNVFEDCGALEEAVLPADMKAIPRNTFYGCSQLRSVGFSDQLTEVGVQAFFACHRLAELDFPDTLTKIGKLAFYNCESLTNLVLPAQIEIGEDAFRGCAFQP